MERTYFDYIGAADFERIHSATIAWMISDRCKALKLEERVRLLNNLFGTDFTDIISIDAYTEFKHIDIAFITTNNKGNTEFWAIENKIKAPLGKNQLNVYSKTTKSIYDAGHLSVLTLIGTLPQDDTKGWHNVTYSQLLNSLESICKNNNSCHQHFAIIKEYKDSISNLVYSLEQFREHPNDFKLVFTDGDKKKSDKIEYNNTDELSVAEYISQNGLETIFQKDYFVGIINKLKDNGINWGCHISETHGNADFATEFGSMGYLQDYLFDLSFQKGTFKFAVTKENYPKLNSKNEEKWPHELKKWKEAFDGLRKKYRQYKRLNSPKTNVRISVSYNFDKDLKDGRRWFDLSIDEFIEIVMDQVRVAQEMAHEAIIYHKKAMQN